MHCITIGITITISSYIFGPMVSQWLFPCANKNPDKIRKDRYTTGLQNKHNDCFANASLQALVPLPSLVLYINLFYSILEDIETHLHEIPIKLDIRMHLALGSLLTQLQMPIFSPRSASPDILLNTLEQIYSTMLSPGQQDAQEFLQILIETLKNEYDALKAFIMHKKIPFRNTLPKFPILGRFANSLVCLRCYRSSRVNTHEFTMHSLPLPQTRNTDLQALLFDNQTEIIEGYSCVCCNITFIISNERRLSHHSSSTPELQQLTALLPDIAINDSLPEPLHTFVANYINKNHAASNLKTSILKRTVVVKSPKILIIHLSRSTYNSFTFARNNCEVNYTETIVVNEQILDGSICVGVCPITYKLLSIVKHTGSHFQGHYECYRHKPNFKTLSSPTSVVIASPLIQLPSLLSLSPSSSTGNNEKGFSRTRNSKDTIGNINTATDTFHLQPSACSKDSEPSIQQLKDKGSSYKTLKTALKFPWWKISDHRVSEHKKTTMLNEKRGVYMLYYQRIDSDKAFV